MEEVGKVVEYRVLEKMASAFVQGGEVDAMVIILSGRCVLPFFFIRSLVIVNRQASRVRTKKFVTCVLEAVPS